MRPLEGKRILVTGAAHGIGQALSRRLASDGCHVLATDLTVASLQTTVQLTRDAGGSGAAFALDVTSSASIGAAREAIHAEGGAVDGIVNNAGVIAGGGFLDLPLEQHLHTFRVNALGLVAVTHAFLPDLIASSAGYLVNIASASGMLGLPWGSSYASSKWAVIGLSESLRLELRELGHRHVQVTTVCPSYADTGMFAGSTLPYFTRLLSADVVADRAVRGMLAGRPFVRTPLMVKTVMPMRGLLPTAAFDLMAKALGATSSMRGWRGHSAAQRGEDDSR